MIQDIRRLIDCIKFKYAINQREIANRIDVHNSYLSDVINGRRPFSESLQEKFRSAFPGVDDWGEQNDVQNSSFEEIPLVPLAAMGGSLSDYEGSVDSYECEWIASPVRGATMAIPVSGDSMAPEFPNGSTVIVKRIDERAFIEWGRTYVLDTVNGVVIKNLVPSEKGDGWVRCLSVNSAPQFAPFDVSLSDVRAIYRVVVSMAMK